MTAAGGDGGRRTRVRVRTVAVTGAVLAALTAVVVAGVHTANATTRVAAAPAAAPAATWAPPPANAGVDYQIGEPYRPPAGVRVVSRDHDVSPAAGLYNICYVNGFQTQTEAASWWRTNHNDLLLHHNGKEVKDPDWNEIFLDITTAAKRDALAGIVGGWIDQCAAKGFQAVEVDNLDTYTRSNGLLTSSQALAYAKLLAAHAHAKGLAIAQKNTVELSSAGRSTVGFDFAVAEECANYELRPGVPECQGYIDAYGDHVIVIEYDTTHFRQACSRYGAKLSIVRRDRDVSAPGSSTYAFGIC
jgi:hypothetical protein